jgi:hypothetical protein
MIRIDEPDFKNTYRFLDKLDKFDPYALLHNFGEMGVSLLAAATPHDTGETASRWDYKIEGHRERYTITWTNSAIAGTAPLVLLLQYGHNTKNGYWLPGRDFINPALYPIYDTIVDALAKEARL